VLVSTIQSDTNEAVVSMERSTTDVVGGALLAENAGAALEEIEQVSHQMAVLIQNISETGRDQNKLATAINKNMLVLRQIASKTTQSTAQTSAAIHKLSELASQLRETVRGFRLPDNHGATGLLSPQRVADSLAREEAEAQAQKKAQQTTVPPVSSTTEAALAAVAAQLKSAPKAAPAPAPAPKGTPASKGAPPPKGAQRTKVTG
jgi:ABC-type transporter Mla subunit MlaD